MKKTRTIIASALAAVILLLSLCSCSTAPAAIEYNGNVITSNMYQFYMSRYKGEILSNYNSGQDNAAFWTQELDEDGTTIADFFKDLVTDNIKITAICLGLFDEYGLSLNQDVYDSIDGEIAEFIDGFNSRAEFNLEMANYGVNDKILRDIYIMDAKVKAVYSYLYGTGGIDAITDEQREEHYEQNYVHIKTIFINTSYDFVLDDNGDYTYDDDGYAVTEEKTEEEVAAAKARSEELKALLTAGEDFEKQIEKYTDDPSYKSYTDGFYFTKLTSYYGDVIDVAFELEEGEWGVAESEYGIHYVLRLPLTDEGYKNENYEEFFSDMDSNIAQEKFDAKVNEYIDSVKVNEDVISQYDLMAIEQNVEY